jgi:hypothetical protein
MEHQGLMEPAVQVEQMAHLEQVELMELQVLMVQLGQVEHQALMGQVV